MAQADPSSPTEVPVLPARATSDGTHRRLLEEALLRFARTGYHGVSVREIARAAGVQASSLYSHLESKEHLLFELMLVGHEEHYQLLREALLESGNAPEDQIARLVRAHVLMHVTYPLLARICNRELEALGPENRTRVRAVRNQSEQLFVDVIERGSRLGVFRVPDPWLATAAIGGMGIRVAEWWSTELGFSVDDVVSAYCQFALRMLREA
jgi:AcrR family transcriptional regulator